MTLPTTNLVQGINTQPANAVYAGGHDEKTESLADAVVVTPGYALIRGSADGKVAVAGALALNVIGIAAENTYQGVESYLTAFAATGDKANIPIYYRRDLMFYAPIKASSAALVFGDALKTASDGTFEKFVQGTDSAAGIVAYYFDQAGFTPSTTVVRKLAQRC